MVNKLYISFKNVKNQFTNYNKQILIKLSRNIVFEFFFILMLCYSLTSCVKKVIPVNDPIYEGHNINASSPKKDVRNYQSQTNYGANQKEPYDSNFKNEKNDTNYNLTQYEIGIRNNYKYSGFIEIKGNIKSHEWEKNSVDDSWFGSICKIRLKIKLHNKTVHKSYKNGFRLDKKSNFQKERYYLDPDMIGNGISLYVYVHGFHKKPSELSIKLTRNLNYENDFINLTAKDFKIGKNHPIKIIKTYTEKDRRRRKYSFQSGIMYHPVLRLYFKKQTGKDIKSYTQKLKNEYRVSIKGYELIHNLADTCYIEFLKNNVIIAIENVDKKIISKSFPTNNTPTSVRIRSYYGSIINDNYNPDKHLFHINLLPLLSKIHVINEHGNPVENANVNVKYIKEVISNPIVQQNNKKYLNNYWFFNQFKSLFNYLVHRDSSSFEKKQVKQSISYSLIDYYSSQTNNNGDLFFINWRNSSNRFLVDISKYGYIGLKEKKIYDNKFVLFYNKTHLKNFRFQYKSCEGESSFIHEDKGLLEIYEQNKKIARLNPKENSILPFCNNPKYRFSHPDYIYNDVIFDSSGVMIIQPLYKIQRPYQKQFKSAEKEQVLIIFDATDQSSKGLSFPMACDVIVKYLKYINWDNYLYKKDRIKVAAAFMNNLEFINSSDKINNSLRLINVYSSPKDQLKIGINSFNKKLKGHKRIIFIVSSKQAVVNVKDNFADLFDIAKLQSNKISINCIVIGSYGGEPLKKLSKKTFGKFLYSINKDEIYSTIKRLAGNIEQNYVNQKIEDDYRYVKCRSF